jgi:heme/copper-type cytochrome/quinol oxidase subunit 1
MTITENPPEAPEAPKVPEVPQAAVAPERRAAALPTGLAGWVTTVDHKRIGRLYMGVSFVVLAGALVVGGLLALERIDATAAQILNLDSVLQLLSLYRFGLVFAGVLPLLLGLAIAVVPLQVGAYRIAFPRAAAASFWGWLLGSGLMVLAYAANGGPGGGDPEAVDLFLVSLGMVVVSLLLGAVCVVVTTLTMRTAGMTLGRAPLLAWSSMVTGVMLLLSLPVLVGDIILLYTDHHYGRVLFGGNLGIGSYLEWSVSQPQTYLYALIGLGVVADIVPVIAKVRQPLRFTALGAIGILGAVSFGAYLQPVLQEGVRKELVFAVAGVAAVVPVIMLFGLWVEALRSGEPPLASPLFYGIGAGLLALGGAAAGVLVPFSKLDLQGSQYELGQFNFVLLAGALAGFGGLVFWGPKLWGRRLPGRASRGLAVVGVIAVVLVALPDLILGFMDQPLGEVNFQLDQESLGKFLNGASFAGYVLLLIVSVAFAALAVRYFGRAGQVVDGDPWDGQTLEWATSSPPPADEDFAEWVGEVSSPEPLLDRKEARASEEVKA